MFTYPFLSRVTRVSVLTLKMYVLDFRIDKDKNGSISGDELQQALANGMFWKCFNFLGPPLAVSIGVSTTGFNNVHAPSLMA